jgi:serine phosphatase RsbU (regulator of sigma subunit)
LIGVPLTVKGEVYGVLLAQESGSASGFRGRRLEIISGIAQQAALAIQNANLTREMVGRERLEREIQLAREIQRTFLPSQLPSPDGWQVNYRWRTARQVGGDFYDCFELSENRLGIVIADVSDKGMPAAMVMTVSRTLIRATALEYDSPASVLERVNGLLLMDSQTGMFITVVYAILDLKSSELVYCVAGQNLPLWIHSQDGAIEPFIKDGVALGVWPDIHLHDHLIRLAQGDTLVFYTDGVTDANSPEHEFFGEERLLLALNESLPTSVEDVLDRIDSAVVTFQGDEPSADDMTLLVIYKE